MEAHFHKHLSFVQSYRAPAQNSDRMGHPSGFTIILYLSTGRLTPLVDTHKTSALAFPSSPSSLPPLLGGGEERRRGGGEERRRGGGEEGKRGGGEEGEEGRKGRSGGGEEGRRQAPRKKMTPFAIP